MKFLSYFLSFIFGLTFLLLTLIFDPLQRIALKLFGYKGHKVVLDFLNYLITKSLILLGIRVKVINKQTLPKDTSIIFVSNHQSLFDIPPIVWAFRKYHPKFVSKKELGRGMPSVSFNLRHGGACLIDRNDKEQAVKALNDFGKRVNKNKWSAVIFPEGSRSRDGNPKRFAPTGLLTIMEHNPDAYIVPLSINNSWKIFKYGKFPLGIFSPMTILTHKPVKISDMPQDDLLAAVEKTIKDAVTV